MDNVVNLEIFRKNKQIEKKILENKDKKEEIKIEVTPEQLRRIALSFEQTHLGRVRDSKESNIIIPEYELTIMTTTMEKKPVKLIWFPMKET